MVYTRVRSQAWTRWFLSSFVFLTLSAWTQALDTEYCSPDNDAGSNYINSIWMSNGRCQDNCKGSYVFAVIQGQDCWCSDYIPANQDSTSSCSDPCPGFPDELCGNSDQGLYAYFNLGGTPSGTAGAGSSSSSPTRTTTSSPSSSAESSTTSSSSSSRSSASSATSRSSNEPTSVYTSIISVTGQVSTIVVTPTAAPQNTDSALGANSQSSDSGSGGGLSGGTVAGIVVGVAIVIGLIIGGIVFFWLRRRHRRNLDAISEGGSYTSPSHASKSNGGIPSRQVSQMSSAGLLTKPSRMNTGAQSSGGDDSRTGGVNSDRNSTHMTVDQRLNPWAIYSNEVSRASNVSLQDNQDYSRQLRVANPDP